MSWTMATSILRSNLASYIKPKIHPSPRGKNQPNKTAREIAPKFHAKLRSSEGRVSRSKLWRTRAAVVVQSHR